MDPAKPSRQWTYDKKAFLDLLKRRGIRDPRVLKAMEEVPRDHFVGLDMAAYAYDDSPLPIGEGQTISQPYIVALMSEALQLRPGDRVLEIGTGSGYAAAVLSRIAGEVYTIERHRALAEQAERRLRDIGYDNVHVLCADGTLGWPEQAPFDAIVVTAGGPAAPPSLQAQLVAGGRMVIPAGESLEDQRLLRLTRGKGGELQREELCAVRFVPLIGEEGWREEAGGLRHVPPAKGPVPLDAPLPQRIAALAEPFESIGEASLGGLLDRIGDARLVLLGEASHGTAEFYDMRARISRELIEKKGFRFLAVEADWPDAAQIDRFLRGQSMREGGEPAFTRFPTWMWANRQVLEFLKRLRDWNAGQTPDRAVGFFGLDLYSLYSSIQAVIGYLEEVDPEAAAVARHRYGCLTPWQEDPALYGAMAVRGRLDGCEEEVARMLEALARKRLDYEAREDGRGFLDAMANARLVSNAEKYYRVMYKGSVQSWNLRDTHMFETLCQLLDFHGPESRAIVWAHNSHLGDARATEMGERGEINLGSQCRERFGEAVYAIGFGTHTGTVAAAPDWGAPMEIKQVRPSHPRSYEGLCHAAGIPAFLLPLRRQEEGLRKALAEPRLERAIGVIYRPESELASHYFHAELPRQFDEYVWFDHSSAVEALGPETGKGTPETFPFGL